MLRTSLLSDKDDHFLQLKNLLHIFVQFFSLLEYNNIHEKKVHISLITILYTENKTFKSGSFHENKKSLIIK